MGLIALLLTCPSSTAGAHPAAVFPGALRAYSTIHSLGIEWDVINSPVGVVVTRGTFENNHYGIHLQGAGSNWYIADNAVRGDPPASSESLDGEGIDLNTTSGHTVAHNRPTGSPTLT